MLESHGMRGTFYVNSGTIASKPYFMNWPQVDALAAAGHEIGGHTIDHKRLTTLTADEQRREVCDDAATLQGARVRGHQLRLSLRSRKHAAGGPGRAPRLRVHHGAQGRRASERHRLPRDPLAESLPPARPYGVLSSPLLGGQITLAKLQDWVTQVEAHGGGWLQLVFHDICDGCMDDAVAGDFAAFLDWLGQRSAAGTVVKPARQALAEGPQHPPRDDCRSPATASAARPQRSRRRSR